MRISTPYSNNSVNTALLHRSAILANFRMDGAASIKACPFGENIKMIQEIKQKQIILTVAEQDEAIAKYESGMNMSEIARLYDCHYTTIGRLLRNRGIMI